MANFPYKKTTNDDYFPIVNFTLYFKNNIAKTSALLDSGATISVFRSDVADQLNIQIEKGEKIYMHGVGGRIMGRDSFFDKFKITFEEKKKSVTLYS